MLKESSSKCDPAEMAIKKQKTPFLIPPPLKDILEKLTLEMGSGNGVGSHLPATHFWIISVCGTQTAFFWTNQQIWEGEEECFINFAVVEDKRGMGIASHALDKIEPSLRALGVNTIGAQVNSNNEESGLRVRFWLLRRGYILVRERVHPRHQQKSDQDILRTNPSPVWFRKELRSPLENG